MGYHGYVWDMRKDIKKAEINIELCALKSTSPEISRETHTENNWEKVKKCLDKPLTACYIKYVRWEDRYIEMRLAGPNLDGSAKIRPTPKKEMTAAEVAELKKLLDKSFKNIK